MNQENTTNSTTDSSEHLTTEFPRPKVDLTIKLSNEDINNLRKEIKEQGVILIDNAINYFVKMNKEGLEIKKIDFLNILIYNAIIYLETNSSKLVVSNEEDLSSIDGDTITHQQALAIYELGLWKRINDFLENNPILNIFDSIDFLNTIKNYILNTCYKNL